MSGAPPIWGGRKSSEAPIEPRLLGSATVILRTSPAPPRSREARKNNILHALGPPKAAQGTSPRRGRFIPVKRARSSKREALNACPITAPDLPVDAMHFITCPECGQDVDCRRLGDVLHHDERGHEPLPPTTAAPPLAFVEPMLPTLVDVAPEGDGWSHEIK